MSRLINQLQQQLIELKSNKLFEVSVIFIIIFSALLTGAKTYEVHGTLDAVIYWLDHFITVFFLFEITIRLLAEPRTLDFFKNGWNIFDFVIVVVSLIPIDGSETALIARLLRVFRLLRLVSIVPQLRILINSLIKALPGMAYIALLMFIIFYIYGAIGSFMFGEINPTLWGNIAIALLTLFRVATFEDWTDVMYETMEVYPLSWIFYLTFIFLTAFVFLNMMIGVILDVMQKEQQLYDQDLAEQEAEEVHWIKQEMSQLTNKLDKIEALLENRTK